MVNSKVPLLVERVKTASTLATCSSRITPSTPRTVFTRSTNNGTFEFTIATPPGRDNIEIASITLGFPIVKESDAAITGQPVDLSDLEGEHSHGPGPSHEDTRWAGKDSDMKTQATASYFQQPYFQGSV